MKHKSLKKVLSMAVASTLVLGAVQSAMAGTHVVQEGEWLSKIAPKYDTTWQNLAETNKLANPDLIYPGQKLQVPDKGADLTELSALDVVDITTKDIFDEKAFDPDKTAYEVEVQSDIYGVLIKAEADAEITVTADKDTYGYGAATPSYVGGTEIAYNEAQGGYLVPLDQTYEGYDDEFVQTATIAVEGGKEYTVEITREDDSDIYALFEELTYTDKETGLTLPYELYIPSNYDASKDYPVVYVLHGAGQRSPQPLDMVLKRYQSATIWAKDSEAGINECIVVSPQIVPTEGNGWTTFMIQYDGVRPVDDPYALQPWGIAAHNLLQEIKADYSVDENRIYATGLSMGGFGSFATAVAYPDEFAAILPVCGGLDPEKAAVLKDKVAVWLYHAKDDPAVPYDEYGATTIAALEAAGVDYKATVYEAGEIFYPNAHFTWTPAYANEEARNWLFEQSKDPVLTKLDVVDVTTEDIFAETLFNPAKTNYDVKVQSDIYAVLVKADAGLKVTGEVTTYDYTNNVTYAEDTAIKYNADLGGYVVPLGQRYEDYDVEFVQTAVIKANDKEYKIKITRECDKEIYDLFEQKVYNFKLEDGSNYEFKYNVYFPTDFDETKEYPLVFALHGNGQSNFGTPDNQPVDMILKRYQMATVWAKDSEADPEKECIVLAGQVDKAYSNYWGLGEMIDVNGQAAFELLETEFLSKDYVDKDRIYVTGLSLGGMGTYAMISNYPELFAAALPVCGMVDDAYDYSKLEPMSGRIYICHAEGDPSVNFENFGIITAGLDKAGVDYLSQTWTAKEVFYPHPHFSWTPAYASEEIRDWVFAQTR